MSNVIEQAIARSVGHAERVHCAFAGTADELRRWIDNNVANGPETIYSEELDGTLGVAGTMEVEGIDTDWRLCVTLISYPEKDERFRIGDHVEGGHGEDRDSGVVSAVDGDQVTVRWDSQVVTTQHFSVLSLHKNRD